ncbi:DUF4136 domain-containing protein [Catalinimonas sp. 4WD22]|uniref:DUF4136 domain-containing protein n=1 Tax=Catalinimonas locisalis TaxID=3133978 RepID=UPI00310198BF
MKLYKQLIPILGIISILFTQCGPTVQTNKTASVDLSKFDTYAYLPNSDTVDYTRLQEELVEEKTMEAINTQMQEVGYNVNKDNPDLLIKTHIMFDQEENVVADPIYTSYNYYYPGYSVGYTSPYYYTGYTNVNRVAGYDIDEVEYTEGTMAVDIINAETNEIVWRGWAEETISPDNFEEDLKSYVEEIFDEYPVEDA